MKRATRIAIIGCLHTSIYLFILPKVLLPLFEGETKAMVRIIISSATIVLTIAIIRVPKYLRKRSDKNGQENIELENHADTTLAQ